MRVGGRNRRHGGTAGRGGGEEGEREGGVGKLSDDWRLMTAIATGRTGYTAYGGEKGTKRWRGGDGGERSAPVQRPSATIASQGVMTRAKRTIIRLVAWGFLLLFAALLFAPRLPALVATLLLVAAMSILTAALVLAIKAYAERERRL